jgi:hypothetical protein
LLGVVAMAMFASIATAAVTLKPGNVKLSHGRYGFKLSYTETLARLNTISGPGAGTHTHTSVEARVELTGTLASATLIKGTASVTATGWSQPASQYRATLDESL